MSASRFRKVLTGMCGNVFGKNAPGTSFRATLPATLVALRAMARGATRATKRTTIKTAAASALAVLLLTMPLHPRTPDHHPAGASPDRATSDHATSDHATNPPANPSAPPAKLAASSQLAPDPGGKPSQQAVTGQRDQTDLSVTVYNSDLSLVRDVRDLALPGGTFQLKFMDIAASVNPATVHFRSLNDPALLSVLEQNYEYDLLEPAKLLAKYVGREVTLLRPRAGNGADEMEEVKATLIADNNGPIWKIGNDIVTGLNPVEHPLPGAAGQSLRPPDAAVDAGQSRRAKSRKWKFRTWLGSFPGSADYVLNDQSRRDQSRSRRLGDAGERQRHGVPERAAATGGRRTEPRARVQAQAKALGDFAAQGRRRRAPRRSRRKPSANITCTTLDRRTSVMNNETKQISLLDASNIPLEKAYEVDGQTTTTAPRCAPAAPIKDPVQVYYKFKNAEKANLGMPLAGGNHAHLPGRLRTARRSSPEKTALATRPRTKRSACTPATPSTWSPSASRPITRTFGRAILRDGIRDHAAQSQDRADHRGSE